MRIPCTLALMLSAIGVIANDARAGDFQVLYAEAIALRAEDARNAVAASEAGTPQAISFQAYGRQFDLELESNARLLSKLDPERRAALSRYELLRGRLSGLPGSWVRLTRIGSELHGAIWDGNDLYFIEPARITARFAVSPLATSGSTSVVYRLSDTQSDLGPQFCDVRSTGKESTALAAYKALIAELGANAALATVPGSQIEVAVLGDFEFFTKYQLENPQGVLLSTMNIVDGIYSSQVGVTILVPVVTVFSDPGDPFTTNVPQGLLDELATYRQNTPEVQSRGLAHLITGRDLLSNAAGIAYLDALCDPFFGVGVTDDSFGNANTPLIAAHEIGHNFGAPHDAEAGSVCASVPPNFIMAPDVNGSSTFSQCSLDQMRPRIATAACITRSSIGDAAVVIEPSTIRGLTGDILPLAVQVNSVGTAPVRDVTVSIQSPVTVQSATVPGGTCSVSLLSATCQLGTINDGSSRRIELGVRSVDATTGNITASVTASNDREPSNNAAQASIIVDPAADTSQSLSPASIDTFTRRTFDLTGIVTSTGPRAATDVVATIRISAPEMSLLTATSDGGTCTSDANSVTCSYGTVAPGAAHRIDVQYRGMRAGQFSASLSVTASNDGNRFNNLTMVPVRLAPARDVTVQNDTPSIIAQLNQPFTISGSIRSVGPETVNDVIVSLNLHPAIVVDAVTVEGTTCAALPCTIGAMPSGTSRRLVIQARGTQLISLNGSISARASDFDELRNDTASLQIEVRHGTDVALFPFESRGGPEGQSFFLNTPVRSLGVAPATNIAVSVSIPTSFTLRQVTLANGNCTTNANNATCTLNSLAAGAEAQLLLEMRGAVVGTFNGTITASAAGDGDDSNNVQNITLQVIPFMDVGVVTPPQVLTASVGELFVFPISVAAGPQPVADVRVQLSLQNLGRYTIVSMAPSVGSCLESPGIVECALGTLPAQGSAAVNISLRANSIGTDSMRVSVQASNDMNFSNNLASVQVVIANRGNAAVRVGSPSATGTVNQLFSYPTISVSADRTVDAVFVDISLPPGVVVEELTGDGLCGGSVNMMTCDMGTITAGIDKHISPRVRASQLGTFSSAITLRSILDTNSQDNSGTVSITVSNAPSPGGAGADNSGGGGGGGLGLLTLLALLAPAALRRERTGASPVN